MSSFVVMIIRFELKYKLDFFGVGMIRFYIIKMNHFEWCLHRLQHYDQRSAVYADGGAQKVRVKNGIQFTALGGRCAI